ncbi:MULTISPECIES: serine/threonine-protein kinase [unclassified Streptomyces]|uniref:serine/threonine-protein kinase n=1 Tax=unclassified Streptomyces TaxID=2593676 RepID=UPI002DDA0C0F|nr:MULTISPECIES: serine/threonine-protein kinase [unclassified Streptomyces]WSA97604.1 serine/threonine-protein kinase [Streptomyces sp. NBC_01795]WSB82148.1 serine/threonine-protein kinase [Streptomyces sp. NBC_01775]WSS18119.1 serine/threonine-protein kinase [Streptomyces sp. NBC_01186]WSS46879.1 serine/threonine-protein kinase [Streptomyces sp. NBC_01187]
MIDGESGQVLDGRFELVERLGSGGMGTVWRARDIALHREVAVKQVRPLAPELVPKGSDASRVLRERVLSEARALARLSHPHVVTIYHVIDDGDGSYPLLVMELVPGSSLAELLNEGTLLTPQEAARVGRQVLAALRTAHAAGIRHRDVKPANVMLRPDGDAVLTDFGIAALQRTGSTDSAVGSAPLTATGELIGTPDYLAPERIRGTNDDPASDLWSLGMTLYVCVEGHNPLRRQTSLATMAAVLDGAVPPPVRAGALAPVLTELLVTDSAARPSAERLDAMLAAAESGKGTTAKLPEAFQTTQTARVPAREPGPMPPPAAPSRRRRSWLIAGATMVATVLVAVTAYTLGNSSGDGNKASGGASSPGQQENKLQLVKPGTLRVATYSTGALDSKDASGDVSSLDVDLAKALGEQLGLKVEIVDTEGYEGLSGLRERSYDLVMPTDVPTSVDDHGYDTEAREGVDLVHYFDSGYTVYTTWATAHDIHSWADLCGMRVATRYNDEAAEKAIRAASYKECGPKPIKQTSEDGLKLDDVDWLRKRSIDAVVTDLDYAVYRAKNTDGDFHLPDGDLTDGAPIGIAVNKSNTALRDATRKALNALINSGEYGKILSDWGLEHGAVTTAQIIRG